jgi:hypothetical protein
VDFETIEKLARKVSRRFSIPKRIKGWYDHCDKMQDARELVIKYSKENYPNESQDGVIVSFIGQINDISISNEAWIVARAILAFKDRMRHYNNVDSFGASFKLHKLHFDDNCISCCNIEYSDDIELNKFELVHDFYNVMEKHEWNKQSDKKRIISILKEYMIGCNNMASIARLHNITPTRVSQIITRYNGLLRLILQEHIISKKNHMSYENVSHPNTKY